MLIDILAKNAKEAPDDIGLVMLDKKVSWSKLYEITLSYREALQKFAGKRALLFLQTEKPEDLALLIASSGVAMESILISAYHTPDRAIQLLKDMDGDLLISVEQDQVTIMAENTPQTTRLPITKPYVCILTSGTTGVAKCAVHQWQGLMAKLPLKSTLTSKKWFVGFSLITFAGLQVFLQCFINRGCLVIGEKNLAPADAKFIISKNAVNYLNCTPTYAWQLVRSLKRGEISSLMTITLGGETVEQQLINMLKEKIPNAKIVHIYASTEIGSTLTVKDEKEGFPLHFIDNEFLRIHEGELYVARTESAMLRYIDSRRGKRAVKLPDSPDKVWFPTGDIVSIENDRVKFLGRQDQMINVGGFKVYPSMVEEVIRKIDGVLEVAVFGVKNPLSGNLVKASINIAEGVTELEIKKKILEACKKNLPYYAVPRLFDFPKTLPLTNNFKLKRAG